VHIDVHTGLGPHGVDTLMLKTMGGEQGAERAKAIEIFGDPKKAGSGRGEKFIISGEEGVSDASTGYEETVGFTAGYLDLLGYEDAHTYTQEFGTVPTVFVFRAMIREHAAYINTPFDSWEREYASHRLRSVFYPQDNDWMASIQARGLTAMKQALTYLSAQAQAQA